MKQLRKDFFKYTSLNILSMVGVSIYILADTYFISKAVGSVGLAALNFSIVIFTLFHGVGLMLGIGGAIDFSVKKVTQGGSAGDQSFMTAIGGGALFSIFFMLLGLLFSRELSFFLGADSVTIQPTQTYLRTILLFTPLFIMNNIVVAYVRNDKNPRLAMIAMVVSSLFNIVFDYVLMFPLSMGIFGAAFATSLSPAVGLMILMVHFRRRNTGFHFRRIGLNFKYLLRILRLGFPTFVTELASSITLFTFNITILRISGNIGVAAYGVIANVALVATALFTGLAQGIQPLASEYHANADEKGMKAIIKYGLISAMIFAVIMYTGIQLYSDQIVNIFNSEASESLALIAGNGLKIYFTGFIFAGINIVLISFLSAKSSTSNAMILSILRSSLVLIPAVLILGFLFDLNGIWASFVLTELFVTVWAYIGVKRKKHGSKDKKE